MFSEGIVLGTWSLSLDWEIGAFASGEDLRDRNFLEFLEIGTEGESERNSQNRKNARKNDEF